MSGNSAPKMNVIFTYHLNIHIHFLNLTFTCIERRHFSREECIRHRLSYYPVRKKRFVLVNQYSKFKLIEVVINSSWKSFYEPFFLAKFLHDMYDEFIYSMDLKW
jgi:hypothetical protein